MFYIIYNFPFRKNFLGGLIPVNSIPLLLDFFLIYGGVLLFVTFNIIITHIFPKNFIKIPHAA